MGAMTARQTRRRRGLPWLVLGLWVVLLAVAPPFAARLADVQHDRATDHLPASADSTRVAEPADRLPGGETTRLVLIYRSPVLWLVPLAVAGLSDLLARSAAYGLDQAVGTSVTGQSAGIMTIRVTRCAPAPPASW